MFIESWTSYTCQNSDEQHLSLLHAIGEATGHDPQGDQSCMSKMCLGEFGT